MKKEIKKLSLNKKTISNLNSSEMSRVIGGSNTSYFAVCCHGGGNHTYKGKKCTF
jgi:natural product precursor